MIYFLTALTLSFILTLLVRRLALKFTIIDYPDGNRKLHAQPVPMLGGVAIFLAFWLITGYIALFHPVFGVELLNRKLLGAFIASTLLVIIGIADDIKQLSARVRLLLTALIMLAAIVVGGLGIEKVNSPWAGTVELSLAVGNILVFFWLMGMMYTTKVLDGLDGLATGIVGIGALTIFFFTQTTTYYQPNVGLLALIFTAVCLGFLIFNFYPAKIFLGEAGSLFIGFMLAVLAVIAGSKMAIAALVMAVPIFDLGRVMVMRSRRRQSLFQGDREHLHFQLVDQGWKHRRAVALFYGVAAVLGVTTLFLQSMQKIVLLGILLGAMVLIGWWLSRAALRPEVVKKEK